MAGLPGRAKIALRRPGSVQPPWSNKLTICQVKQRAGEGVCSAFAANRYGAGAWRMNACMNMIGGSRRRIERLPPAGYRLRSAAISPEFIAENSGMICQTADSPTKM
jgi:hypothetical protein